MKADLAVQTKHIAVGQADFHVVGKAADTNLRALHIAEDTHRCFQLAGNCTNCLSTQCVFFSAAVREVETKYIDAGFD